MKKYLIVSLALLSLLALAGCGGSEAPEEYTPPAGVAVHRRLNEIKPLDRAFCHLDLSHLSVLLSIAYFQFLLPEHK